MDFATILGIILCFVMLVLGIASGPDGFASLPRFMDLTSAILVFGGSMASLLASTTIAKYINALKSFKIALRLPENNEVETIRKIIELSNVARKEGLLALEEAANNLEDEFMKKGILLIVDGTDPELVRAILETELFSIEARHKEIVSFYDTWSILAPAWGMKATLIGLVNMLKNLDDIATIGPNMSMIMITTLYGSLVANVLCVPVSKKLSANNDTEIMMKEVMIEGLLSIQAGENPRVIEEKLKSFLSPKRRSVMEQENAESEGE